MSFLKPDGSTVYDWMNEEMPLQFSIDMDKLAETIELANYGTVRFLAALARFRKVRHANRVAEYRRKGNHDAAEHVEREGDRIVVAIEKLLREDAF